MWSGQGLVVDTNVNLTSKGIGTLWDFRQGKGVRRFITFRKTSLRGVWIVLHGDGVQE